VLAADTTDFSSLKVLNVLPEYTFQYPIKTFELERWILESAFFSSFPTLFYHYY